MNEDFILLNNYDYYFLSYFLAFLCVCVVSV